MVVIFVGCVEFRICEKRTDPMQGPYFNLGPDEDQEGDKQTEDHFQGPSVFPNPFTGRTTVVFSLDRTQVIHLTVFDTTGKMIVELGDSLYGEGEHSLSWAGRDRLGRNVASGTYLLQMACNEGTVAQKMVLVR